MHVHTHVWQRYIILKECAIVLYILNSNTLQSLHYFNTFEFTSQQKSGCKNTSTSHNVKKFTGFRSDMLAMIG